MDIRVVKNNLKHRISWNLSSGSRIVPCGQTDGQTNKYDKTKSRFSQFYEHAYKFYILHSTFYILFMRFVWFSEQNTIICL